MSLILKGIDLPNKDEKYRLHIFKDGTAFVVKEMWDDSKQGREKLSAEIIGEIPVIQIPRPHGRLKDENELKSKVHDVILEGGAKHGCIDKTALHECRTILEAEE